MSNSHAAAIVIRTLADLDTNDGSTLLSNAVKVFHRFCRQEHSDSIEVEVGKRPRITDLLKAMEAEGFERITNDIGDDAVMLGVFQDRREYQHDGTVRPASRQYASIFIIRFWSGYDGVFKIMETEYVFAFGIKGTDPQDEVFNPLSDDGKLMVRSEAFQDLLKTLEFIGQAH